MFEQDIPVHRVKAMNIPGEEIIVPDGVCMLFDRNHDPITEMNEFVLGFTDLGRGLHNTSNSYSDDLANWVMFCDYKGVDWRSATASHLRHYDAILASSVSTITRRAFSRATRSRRIGTVKAFYRFRVNSGFVKDESYSPHYYHRKIKTDRPETKVRFVGIDDLKAILDALGPSPVGAAIRPTRDRTVAEFLLLTGGRLEDAEGLTVTDVLNFEATFKARPDRFLVEHTIVGKGDKSRTVLVCHPLVNILVRYIETTRADIVQAALIRKGKNWRPPRKVFLNGLASNNTDIGKATTKDTLGRAFVNGVKAAGLYVNEDRVLIDENGIPLQFNKEWLKEPVSVPKHSIHDLRHTFSGLLARGLQTHGNRAPFKIVQMLLGHAHLSTTVDVYSGPVALDEPDISDAYSMLPSLFGLSWR